MLLEKQPIYIKGANTPAASAQACYQGGASTLSLHLLPFYLSSTSLAALTSGGPDPHLLPHISPHPPLLPSRSGHLLCRVGAVHHHAGPRLHAPARKQVSACKAGPGLVTPSRTLTDAIVRVFLAFIHLTLHLFPSPPPYLFTPLLSSSSLHLSITYLPLLPPFSFIFPPNCPFRSPFLLLPPLPRADAEEPIVTKTYGGKTYGATSTAEKR